MLEVSAIVVRRLLATVHALPSAVVPSQGECHGYDGGHGASARRSGADGWGVASVRPRPERPPVRTDQGLSDGTSEDGWHALATFANIPLGSTANLEGEPSALIYRYALYWKQLLDWEDLRLGRVGAFDP